MEDMHLWNTRNTNIEDYKIATEMKITQKIETITILIKCIYPYCIPTRPRDSQGNYLWHVFVGFT